jgi:2'-5' RNA ligase
MRLFISVNFDAQTVGRMLDVQKRMRAAGNGNFTRPENLHLTLAFLGEVAPDRVKVVRRVMDGLDVPVLRLCFDRVGRFRRDGGDIWWIGLAENRELLRLQRQLSQRLAEAGFELDSRGFSPHITLARQMRLETEPDCRAVLSEPFSARAESVSLMLSERIGGKLIYTEKYSVAAARL